MNAQRPKKAPQRSAPPQPPAEPTPLEGSVSPREREKGQHDRCGFCHDDVLVTALCCGDCGAIVHADCARDLNTCPTLGCERPATELEQVRPTVEARRRGPLLTLLMAAATILLAVGWFTSQGYLLSEEKRDEAWVLRHAEDPVALVEGLRDPRREVQERALEALRALGPRARPAVLDLIAIVRMREPTTLLVAPLIAELDPDMAGHLFAELLSGAGGEVHFLGIYRACAALDGPRQLAEALATQRTAQAARPYAYAYAHARLNPQLATEVLLEAFQGAPTTELQLEVIRTLNRIAEAGGTPARGSVTAALEQIAGQASEAVVRKAAQARLDELAAGGPLAR